MTPLDEEARALGNQEGKMELVLKALEKHSRQMDRIERKLTTLRIKMGGVSAAVSLVVTIVIIFFRHYVTR